MFKIYDFSSLNEIPSFRVSVWYAHWLIAHLFKNRTLLILFIRKTGVTQSARNSIDHRKSTSQGNNTTIRAAEPDAGIAANGDDMQDIMSQYMPQNNTGKSTLPK